MEQFYATFANGQTVYAKSAETLSSLIHLIGATAGQCVAAGTLE